jgi:hypothetical protein
VIGKNSGRAAEPQREKPKSNLETLSNSVASCLLSRNAGGRELHNIKHADCGCNFAPLSPLGATTGLPLRRDQSRPLTKPDSIITLRPAPLFLLRARPSFPCSTSPHSRESRSLLIIPALCPRPVTYIRPILTPSHSFWAFVVCCIFWHCPHRHSLLSLSSSEHPVSPYHHSFI